MPAVLHIDPGLRPASHGSHSDSRETLLVAFRATTSFCRGAFANKACFSQDFFLPGGSSKSVLPMGSAPGTMERCSAQTGPITPGGSIKRAELASSLFASSTSHTGDVLKLLWCDLGPAVPTRSSGIIPPFVSRQNKILAASDNYLRFKISRKQIIGRLLEAVPVLKRPSLA